MKSPRPRLHLLDVDEPLLAFHDIECRCGIVLHSAVPKFMEATDLPEAVRPTNWASLLGICSTCLDAAPRSEASQRLYTYGLLEGEESMRESVEEAEVAA
jgi:hypothetical protein